MSTLSWCSPSFADLFVFLMVLMEHMQASPDWRPCWFQICENLRKLKFLRCIHVLDMVLKCFSEINDRIGIDLFFHFAVMVFSAASFTGMSFFFCGLDFRLKFSRIAVLQKHLQMDSQSELTKNCCFWSSCWTLLLFLDIISAYSDICNNCSFVFLLCWLKIFSIVFWEVVWSIL